MKLKKFIIIDFLLILTVLAGFLAYTYFLKGKHVSEPAQHTARTFMLKDYELTEYDMPKNEKIFTLKGEQYVLASPKIITFHVNAIKKPLIKNVELIFYDKEEVISRIYADEADIETNSREVYDENIAKIILRGTVTMQTHDHKLLTCDQLVWTKESGMLIAKGNSIYQNQGRVQRGQHFITDPQLNRLEEKKNKFHTFKHNLIRGSI